jgi:hypothetical protein
MDHSEDSTGKGPKDVDAGKPKPDRDLVVSRPAKTPAKNGQMVVPAILADAGDAQQSSRCWRHREWSPGG